MRQASPPLRLTTPRLQLREINPVHDAVALFELNEDPDVLRYTGDGRFASPAAAEAFFRERVAYYQQVGMGRWVVEELSTGQVLGWCGLRPLEDSPEVDLGYRFFRHCWGKGFATEAARICLSYGFGPLALPRIIARIDPRNVASRRVAEKLGMRLLPGTRTCGGIAAVIYEITREEWGPCQLAQTNCQHWCADSCLRDAADLQPVG